MNHQRHKQHQGLDNFIKNESTSIDVEVTSPDPSKKDFYKLKRQYLRTPDHREEPPDIFKTRRQMRRYREFISESKEVAVQSTFINVIKNVDELAKNPNIIRRRAAVIVKPVKINNKLVVISEYTSVNPEDWVEEWQAGVKLWVNRNSGEVTSECPWERSASEGGKKNSKSIIRNNLPPIPSNIKAPPSILSKEEPSALGLGALIYDGSEIQELFKVLENEAKKNKSIKLTPIAPTLKPPNK